MKKKIIRFSVSVNEEIDAKLKEIAEKYCMAKANWVIQAAIEKLEKMEKNMNHKEE